MRLFADCVSIMGIGKPLDIMESTGSSPSRLKPNVLKMPDLRLYCCQGIQQRHASPPATNVAEQGVMHAVIAMSVRMKEGRSIGGRVLRLDQHQVTAQRADACVGAAFTRVNEQLPHAAVSVWRGKCPGVARNRTTLRQGEFD